MEEYNLFCVHLPESESFSQEMAYHVRAMKDIRIHNEGFWIFLPFVFTLVGFALAVMTLSLNGGRCLQKEPVDICKNDKTVNDRRRYRGNRIRRRNNYGMMNKLQGWADIFRVLRRACRKIHFDRDLWHFNPCTIVWFEVYLSSRVWLSATPWTAARQASLSITNPRSSLKLTSIELVIPSSHLILCHPLLLLPSIFPSIRVSWVPYN